MTRVLVDGRWAGTDGIGRFAHEVTRRIPDRVFVPDGLPKLHPLEPLWLSGVIRRTQPDVYYTPGFNPPIGSPVPFVITICDLIPVRFPSVARRAKRLYYRTFLRRMARRAARIVTLSEHAKHEIVQWTGAPPNRVVVAGCGVSDLFVPEGPSWEPGYRYLLHVGSRAIHKNVPRLLAAFAGAQLPRDLRLIFTGLPDEPTQLAASSLGISDRISFAGYLSNEQLAEAYRGATALAFPSLYEGFGLPPLEAMACGTPVVTSNRTSLPEVVGDAAVLVDPTDVEHLASGLRRISSDDRLRDELRTKGVAQAALFTWDEVARRVRRALDDARRSGSRPSIERRWTSRSGGPSTAPRTGGRKP